MRVDYTAPDVYVEEVAAAARPIEAVGARTAGFVGVAPDDKAQPNKALPINNWTEFQKAYFPDGKASTYLSHAVYGFFQNGGSRCYVVNVGAGKPIGGGKDRTGVDLFEQIDEVAIVAAPGYADSDSYEVLLKHCESLENRVAILDGPEQVADVNQLTQVAGGGDAGGSKTLPGLRPRQSDRGFGAFYFPWIVVRDPVSNERVAIPPSGHMAGIWARNDVTRGVHKAPANEPVEGALDLTYHMTRAEQEVLNPAGVNCLRWFASEGIRVWGARTLAASASEWRYLNVRRLFNVIEESIARSTRWIVFEPNDYTLWKSIRRDITAFLTLLWRDGALMGRTPQQAFFVKCDAETNPAEVIDAGRVVTLIGIAPVKPAEFIIFRLSQYAAGTETEVQGG